MSDAAGCWSEGPEGRRVYGFYISIIDYIMLAWGAHVRTRLVTSLCGSLLVYINVEDAPKTHSQHILRSQIHSHQHRENPSDFRSFLRTPLGLARDNIVKRLICLLISIVPCHVIITYHILLRYCCCSERFAVGLFFGCFFIRRFGKHDLFFFTTQRGFT